MSQYLAFISNHPFLAASAAALLGLIVAYELRNATRGYHDVDAADAPRLINHDDAVVLDVRPRDAVRRLLSTLALPLWHAEEMDRALALMERAVLAAPALEVSYPPTPAAAEWIIERVSERIGHG